MKVRVLVATALVLLAACVLIAVTRPGHRNGTRPGDPPVTGRLVAAAPVIFQPDVRVAAPAGWRLLDEPADYVGFAGWIVAAEPGLAARVRALASDEQHVHIALVDPVGCDLVSGPELRFTGIYRLRYTHREERQNCYAPWQALAVFAVPQPGLTPITDHSPPAGVGPGTIAAFFALAGTRPSTVESGLDVTTPGGRQRLLDALAADGDRNDRDRLRADIVAALGPPRLYRTAIALRMDACVGATPILDITSDRVSATTTRPCLDPVPALVVIVVAPHVLPSGAEIR